MTEKNVTAELRLPYYKQGDDMGHGIVKKPDGKIDVKKSFQNHIDLMEYTAKLLTKIKDLIPEDADVDINADTHYISITSDKFTIQRLVDNDLVELVVDEEVEDVELRDDGNEVEEVKDVELRDDGNEVEEVKDVELRDDGDDHNENCADK